MAQVEESLRILEFEGSPSSDHFSSTIEPKNVPAVFRGAVSHWTAISKWNPVNGGLDYLAERVGSGDVEAMLSKSGSVFYGDLRSHERVPVPFTEFVSSCKCYAQNFGIASTTFVAQEDPGLQAVNLEESSSNSLDAPDQLYLAQVPILNVENKERSPLEILRDDIQTPVFLSMKSLTSINLWMNKARSRSSTHYDPYHNLLCVVAGRKHVVLWPPSACPVLYPMPIHGESSNHSAVDIENPDFSVHSRAMHSKEYSQTVILHSGDALFLPEGWFHQVDSDDLTIAVNFWWKSNMMWNMLEHMDAYYLRRILNRLVGKEMDRIVCCRRNLFGSSNGRENEEPANEALKGCLPFDSNSQMENIRGNDEKRGLMLQQLEPDALNLLYKLISSVHDTVTVNEQNAVECTTTRDVLAPAKGDYKLTATVHSTLENDRVASIFWTAEPLVLKRVLLALVHNFPRTLEALVLHVLSPVAAEALTRKFDEIDQQTTKEQQIEFYQLFYSVFDDPYAAMDAILNGKESFAFQAVHNVVDQYLGLYVEKPK